MTVIWFFGGGGDGDGRRAGCGEVAGRLQRTAALFKRVVESRAVGKGDSQYKNNKKRAYGYGRGVAASERPRRVPGPPGKLAEPAELHSV